MANHPSALKRQRQNEKRRERNRAAKSSIKTMIKKVEASKDKKEGEANLKLAVSQLHKAAQKSLIHKKTAAHRISHLQQFVNSLS